MATSNKQKTIKKAWANQRRRYTCYVISHWFRSAWSERRIFTEVREVCQFKIFPTGTYMRQWNSSSVQVISSWSCSLFDTGPLTWLKWINDWWADVLSIWLLKRNFRETWTEIWITILQKHMSKRLQNVNHLAPAAMCQWNYKTRIWSWVQNTQWIQVGARRVQQDLHLSNYSSQFMV